MTPAEYRKFERGCIRAGLIKPGDDPGLGLQAMVHRMLDQRRQKAMEALLTHNLEGWDFDDPKASAASIRTLAARWRMEDALEKQGQPK